MPKSQKIFDGANSRISCFVREQQGDGSFLDVDKADAISSTALVLSCLNGLAETPEIGEVKKKAVDFLLSKKDNRWLFGDNVGVNFLVFSVLMEYDPKIIDGAAMAKILMVLTSVETKEGGPYYFNTNKKDKEIDLGANVAIAYFLSLQDVDLPELDKLIESAIENNDFKSKLFASCHPTIYFISKFYKGDKKEKLIDFILQKKGETKTQLEIFLVESALNNLKNKKSKMIAEVGKDEEEARMTKEIIKKAEKRFFALDGEIKNFAMREIQKTIRGNRDKQMSLMAYYFKKALGKKGEKISDDMIAEIGLANIFFWTAFIIYDDFWDKDEAADPRILPAANLYARHYVDFFTFLLAKETGFRAFFHKLMDELDEANTWETIYCRVKIEDSRFFIPEKLPDYDNYEFKYRPASGHILGPVALLVSLGCGLDSTEAKNLISYFKNYLIAMQINDDAHDWEEDLRRGHLSTVAVMLLKDYQEKYPGKKEIDIDKELQKLKEVFWLKTIITASKTAIRHADKSRQALKSMTILENSAPLERFIIITENVAKKALDEQKKTIDFLKAYKG